MKIIRIFCIAFAIIISPNCSSGKGLFGKKKDVPKEEVKPDVAAKENNQQSAPQPIAEPETLLIEKTVTIRDTIRDTIEKIIEIEVPVANVEIRGGMEVTGEVVNDTAQFVAPRKKKSSSRKMKKEIAALKQQIEIMEKQQESLRDVLRGAGTSFEGELSQQDVKVDKVIANDNDYVAPVFRVQISARKNKVNTEFAFSDFNFDGEELFEEDDPNAAGGFRYKYVIGSFRQPEQAVRYCRFINGQGIINDAWVVAYYKGGRISVKQATEIIERKR